MVFSPLRLATVLLATVFFAEELLEDEEESEEAELSTEKLFRTADSGTFVTGFLCLCGFLRAWVFHSKSKSLTRFPVEASTARGCVTRLGDDWRLAATDIGVLKECGVGTDLRD